MTDAQRCPVRVVSWYPFADIDDGLQSERFIKWTCDERFRGAEFRDRRAPRFFAVIHQSTKTPDKWQVSWFDDLGAVGDCERGTAVEALAEVPPRAWKLIELARVSSRP